MLSFSHYAIKLAEKKMRKIKINEILVDKVET